MRRALFLGLVCSLGVALFGPSALAAESADECVAITRSESPDGLDFEVKNNCDKPLACNMSWTLSCENDKGKTTASSRAGASFALPKDASKHTLGSSASCKTSGWRIEDVSWACSPVK